jgi:predicted SAM-dependent methyltransferase
MRVLEIGPGTHPVNRQWDTMDIVGNPTYRHDVRILPLPIRSQKYDLVYMSHILEHVPWFQTVDLLKEVHRILKGDGTVEIWVPDFKKIVDAYICRKPGDGWRKFNPDRDFMTWINGRLFTYGPGEENWHRAAFDESFLREQLKKAGFRHTAPLKKPRGYDHGMINLGVVGGW